MLISKRLRSFTNGLKGRRQLTDKPFEKIYLHIGLGKTGTTTIQKALLANSELLESQYDLYFPRHFTDPRQFDGNHSLFIASLFGANPLGGKANAKAGILTATDLKKLNGQLLQDFEKGFHNTQARRLVISAERVGHFTRESLVSLGAWLQHHSDSIEVVACFRHPLDALSSTIQQRVKAGDVLEDLYEDPPYYPFKSLLTRLSDVFGRGNLKIYDLADAVEFDGGIVGAFLAQLGINQSLPIASDEVANESWSHEAVLLFSALNSQRPLFNDNALGQKRTQNDALLFANLGGRKFEVPVPVIERLRERVAPQLEWLSENYGICLREKTRSEPEPYRQFSPETIERIACLMSDLARANEK